MVTAAKNTICYHCGDTCYANNIILLEDKPFCCNGCKSVYKILHDNSLDQYYSIENKPGIKPPEENYFDYLELEEVRKKIIQYEDEKQIRLQLFIPSIHCSSCIFLLEQLHKINPIFNYSRINYTKKEITISVKSSPNAIQAVFELLSRLGYAPHIPLKNERDKNHESENLIIPIGIVGFCFGNIMLLSFPEYVSGGKPIDPTLKTIFSLLIIALTIPVLLFGAKRYFKAAYKSLGQKYLSIDIPVALGISALLLRSLYEIILKGNAGYFDSLAGLIFFLLIGRWFQSKTYDHLSFEKDFKSFFPLAILKKQASIFKATPIQELKTGDIIRLRNQEVLPVNASLMNEQATFDYSFVTGESQLVKKSQTDKLFAGGKLIGNAVELIVENPSNQSYLAELWREQDEETMHNKLHSFINKVSHRFTLTILIIACLGFTYWLYKSNISNALEILTSILIVACPCALALVIPFTYGSADRHLGKLGIYLKKAEIIESLYNIKNIVFDKTGTLTKSSSEKITYDGQVLTSLIQNHLSSILTNSIHPLSQQVASHLNQPTSISNVIDYKEITGLGIKAIVDNNHYFIGSLKWLKQNKLTISSSLKNNPSTMVWIGKDKKVLGCFKIGNTYRKGVLDIIKLLKKKFKITILSGDTDHEKEYLLKEVGANVDLLFNQNPLDKQKYIQNTESTIMLGDGINDAAALKASAVGISITEDISTFTPNSDIIMDANQISRLPSLLQFGKDCRKVIYCCLTLSFLYNIIGLTFALQGHLTPFVAAVLMPISSISVVITSTSLTTWFVKRRNLL